MSVIHPAACPERGALYDAQMELCLLYMTVGSPEEARKIAAALMEEKLAACVNVLSGATSFYRWQGKMEQSAEAVMIAKTSRALVPQVTARVKALHSYDCPCVVAMPIEGGNADFLEWIARQIGE